MFQSLLQALFQVDTRLLLLLAGIAAVLFVVSLIKKAIKVGIFLLIVAVVLGGGVPALNNLKNDYGAVYNKQTEVLTLKVSGKSIDLPLKAIKEAKNYTIQLDKGATSTKLSLNYQTEGGAVVTEKSIDIPNFMVSLVKKALEGGGLKYESISSYALQ